MDARGLTSRIPAPMRVAWRAVERTGEGVLLVAEVERRSGFGVPVAVSIQLPAGARLLEGQTDFLVPEGPGGDLRTMTLRLGFSSGEEPVGDVVLVAHAEGPAFGVHARARHAFAGSGHTPEPRPTPTGPLLPAALFIRAAEGSPR
ncbi:hypothetical protein LY474_16375 [Myxococcus stipitatus]|uniref:hypothetical protein n=1 Tax=Myxococcus stipitatus TaxID=83455 RepID=UPI001F1D4615|nr:hypothetical protein [Myxococcus stipitatus]MCE9669387.1 hypothetical protein [Myxococcus stipitatus]